MNPMNWALGIAAIIISIFIYFKSRVRAELTWQATTFELIGGVAPPLQGQLQIIFNGVEISRVTKTIVVFWNSGSKTIYSADVVKEDPLRMVFEDDAKILQCGMIKSSRDVNKVSVSSALAHNNVVNIDFDYLDIKDGAVLDIIHSGKPLKPSMMGTIREMPKGARYAGQITVRQTLMQIIKAISDLVIPLAPLIVSIYYFVNYESLKDTTPVTWMILFLLMGAVFTTLQIYIIWIGRRRYPKKLNIV